MMTKHLPLAASKNDANTTNCSRFNLYRTILSKFVELFSSHFRPPATMHPIDLQRKRAAADMALLWVVFTGCVLLYNDTPTYKIVKHSCIVHCENNHSCAQEWERVRKVAELSFSTDGIIALIERRSHRFERHESIDWQKMPCLIGCFEKEWR